jgi:hypothetical protein
MEASLPMERPFLGPLRLLATSTRVAIFVTWKIWQEFPPKKLAKLVKFTQVKIIIKKPTRFSQSSQIFCQKKKKIVVEKKEKKEKKTQPLAK